MDRTVAGLYHFAALVLTHLGSVSTEGSPGFVNLNIKQPYGVVAGSSSIFSLSGRRLLTTPARYHTLERVDPSFSFQSGPSSGERKHRRHQVLRKVPVRQCSCWETCCGGGISERSC